MTSEPGTDSNKTAQKDSEKLVSKHKTRVRPGLAGWQRWLVPCISRLHSHASYAIATTIPVFLVKTKHQHCHHPTFFNLWMCAGYISSTPCAALSTSVILPVSETKQNSKICRETGLGDQWEPHMNCCCRGRLGASKEVSSKPDSPPLFKGCSTCTLLTSECKMDTEKSR